MTEKKITNIPASVKAKLLHISGRDNIEFNTLLRKYFQERFLYRLSISKHKDSFVLKGGLLLTSIDIPTTRPTMDIDFLADKLKNDIANIVEIFKEIISMPTEDDGIIFNKDNVTAEIIQKDADYNGIRVKMEGKLGSAQQMVQVDLGFGDVIFPDKRDIYYPSLLDENKSQLKAYPLETVIAEKFEAMVKHGILNSRMKDFYDVYMILNEEKLDNKNIKKAIEKTFSNRGTDIPKQSLVFTKEFYEDPTKQLQWNAFLKKSNITSLSLSFKDVATHIRNSLVEILDV